MPLDCRGKAPVKGVFLSKYFINQYYSMFSALLQSASPPQPGIDALAATFGGRSEPWNRMGVGLIMEISMAAQQLYIYIYIYIYMYTCYHMRPPEASWPWPRVYEEELRPPRREARSGSRHAPPGQRKGRRIMQISMPAITRTPVMKL